MTSSQPIAASCENSNMLVRMMHLWNGRYSATTGKQRQRRWREGSIRGKTIRRPALTAGLIPDPACRFSSKHRFARHMPHARQPPSMGGCYEQDGNYLA